jgi:hypothetical protein
LRKDQLANRAVAEIFEAPFLKEPGLTRELLDELGRAHAATLCSPRRRRLLDAA